MRKQKTGDVKLLVRGESNFNCDRSSTAHSSAHVQEDCAGTQHNFMLLFSGRAHKNWPN